MALADSSYVEYAVEITYDAETDNVEVPALVIADYGATIEEALASAREMVRFHLESLQDEGEDISASEHEGEGNFIRVPLPVATS